MNEQDIKDFLIYCGISAKDSTLNKIKIKLDYIKKNLPQNNLELKDIHIFLSELNRKDYATATKNDFIKVLKRFLKWKYKDYSSRFDNLVVLKSNSKDQRKLSKEDLLTPDEMLMINNSDDSMKYKCLLMLLGETAGRPEELIKLKWKDINFNSSEIKLHSSKTGEIRTIPVNKTIDHLRRYKIECFYQTPRGEDKVFNITPRALNKHLELLEKKLKFHKHLYPYLWRHSILTKMIKTLTPKSYENFAGHSLETGMKIYAHLDTEDLRQELNEKFYHLEEFNQNQKELFEQKIKTLEENIMLQKQIQTKQYQHILKLLMNNKGIPSVEKNQIKRLQEKFNTLMTPE